MLRMSDIDLTARRPTELDVPGIQKVYKYLADRGIPRDKVDPLGLIITPAGELIDAARGGGSRIDDPRLAVVFPHHDIRGHQIDWWSARLVDASMGMKVATSFGALVEQKKWGKMFCPPMEEVHAYLPPNLDWAQLKRGDKVYIHESAIKAVNCAFLERWAIGLNGVRGFSSKKHGVALVEELRSIPWKALDLQPTICFDSNAADNWDVQHAISSLAARIYEFTGRKAKHLLLPKSPEGEDWGFDDYRVRHGDVIALQYLDGEGVEVALDGVEALKLKLNTEVCVVRSLGRIAEQETGTIMSRGTFTDVNFAHYLASVEDKIVNVPRLWLQDPRRAEVEVLSYEPGREPMVQGQFLNLWRGMGVEPVGGDVQPWLDLLSHYVTDEALRRWVTQWFAYPLQNLGAKMTTFLHLFGPPGSGKQALLLPLMRIYGKNGVTIARERIASDFNSVYATKQFLNVDEMHGGSGSDGTAVGNKIDMLVTSPEIVVNTKGVPEYTISNHCNLVTTSNHADALKLKEGDRRACVIQFGTRDSILLQSFWDVYYPWAEHGGAAALYSYLLGYDLAGFDANGRAPWTEAKDEVTDATRGAMEKWCRDLWDDSDSILPTILRGAKVLTSEQLGSAYYPNDPAKNTPGLRNALGMRMKEMGFKRTNQIWVDGAPRRFWIIRERDTDWTNDMVKSAAAALGKAKF